MSTKINIGPARREEFDTIIREAAKGHGAVEACIGKRHSYQDEGKVKWQAYERYLLADGHTLFLNLQSKEASVSKEVDKYAQAKVEKAEAKKAKRDAAKATREAKKAEPKKQLPIPEVKEAEATPKPKAKRVRKTKVVKFDKDMPTI